MKVFLSIMAALIIIIGGIALFIWTSYKMAGEKQNGIVAVYEDMKNVYANSIIEVLENKGIVVEKHKTAVLEAIDKNMIRYQNDQNLLFKAIGESSNLTIPTELYADLSRSIESGYRNFENKQSQKIDRVREFKNFLDYSLPGIVAKTLFNFPSDEVKFIMTHLILNKKTDKTFESGHMERPKL